MGKCCEEEWGVSLGAVIIMILVAAWIGIVIGSLMPPQPWTMHSIDDVIVNGDMCEIRYTTKNTGTLRSLTVECGLIPDNIMPGSECRVHEDWKNPGSLTLTHKTGVIVCDRESSLFRKGERSLFENITEVE